MLAKIKILLGIADTSKDTLLSSLIDLATADYLTYTHQEEIDESIVIKMVLYNYNLLGAEGIKGRSYSSVNESYDTDYPESIMRLLKKNRKLITL